LHIYIQLVWNLAHIKPMMIMNQINMNKQSLENGTLVQLILGLLCQCHYWLSIWEKKSIWRLGVVEKYGGV
jgi:hypothetical protein